MLVTRCLLLGMLLSGCAGLPNVLPDEAQEELALPRPEERTSRFARPAFAPRLETYRLANGMEVALLEDHALPRVVVDTWLALGTRDEGASRRGFARAIEQLLARSPRGPNADLAELADLVELVERGGGASHVSASQDRTRVFSTGPSALLATLLARDAARLESGDLDPLDLAPSEPEARPYDELERELAAALYPVDHPYHLPARADATETGPHAAADVLAFFQAATAPANATLVVAGDFEPHAARALVARTFGALARRTPPERAATAPVALARERELRLAGPPSGHARLVLAWHAPAELAPLDAELELLATILAEGPTSRLERRVVLERSLAQEVDASQRSGELGSVFRIEAVAAPDADLDELEREILAALGQLASEGPEPAELERARDRQEARFRRRMESLLARAEALQAYRRAFGVADGFQRDLERWTKATRAGVRDAARAVLGPGRVDLRVLPATPAPVTLGTVEFDPGTRAAPVRGSS